MTREEWRTEMRKPKSAGEYQAMLAQAIEVLGETENVNEHGVYMHVEEVVRSAGRHSVKLRVVKGSDGLWRYGYGYRGPESGMSCPVTIFDTGCATRDSALEAAARQVKDSLTRQGEPAVAICLLEQLRFGGKQLNLF